MLWKFFSVNGWNKSTKESCLGQNLPQDKSKAETMGESECQKELGEIHHLAQRYKKNPLAMKHSI